MSACAMDAVTIQSRLRDAIEKCERGQVARLFYLTPREQKQAERFLRAHGVWDRAWLWGGYPTAERACLFLLPDYLFTMLEGSAEEGFDVAIGALLAEEVAETVCAVRITGSGFRELSHRDYLGSILGLGLERDALGDIAVQDPHEAIVFCPETIAGFLCESLQKVANDTVKCQKTSIDHTFTDGRRYRAIHDTVASPRLDCVVAALTNLSREEAQAAVKTGLVEVDFEPIERLDLLLEPPVTLSVRGYGRFILKAFEGETRKGRLRLHADQLI